MRKKLSSLKNKHTLHIPIKNRPNWLSYSLKMYKHFGYDGTILLVDDSDERDYKKNRYIVAEFKKELDINHLRYDLNIIDEASHKVFNKSKFFSIKKIQTEFYSASSDDDFFNPEFAKIAIPFLINNQSYSSVTGIDVKLYMDNNFDIYKKNFKYRPENLYSDALDRLVCYFYDPSVNHLGVNRVSEFDVIKEEVNNLKKLYLRDDDDFGLPTFDKEFPWAILPVINGKCKVFKNIINVIRSEYISADRDTTKHFFSANSNENYGYINQVLEKTFDKSFSVTYEGFLKIVCLKSKYSKEVLEDTLKKTIWAFINNQRFDFNLSRNLDYTKNKKLIKKLNININFPDLRILFTKNILHLIISMYNQIKRKYQNLIIKYYDRSLLKIYIKNHEQFKNDLKIKN